MTRKETTAFLSELLELRLYSKRGYWASEVWLNYGNARDERRVDYMSFHPAGVTYQSDIEKGTFTCYEVKSCMADLTSGHGMNFVAEKNYVCMPMSLWAEICARRIKSLKNDTPLPEYESLLRNVGVMVPIPQNVEPYDRNKIAAQEFEHPTPLDAPGIQWEYYIMQNAHPRPRRYSMSALLFWMLRAGT